MRTVTINDTDQTLRLFAFDSNSSAVTGLTSGSAGLAVNVIVRQEGIKTGTTDITSSLTTRDTAATHKDYAFTEIGSGEYELDLPDSFFTTAQEVTASIAATAITGRSYSTTVVVEEVDLSMILDEVRKIPRSGETHRYTQVASNTGSQYADVSIGATS